jgi:hypothetical protein
MTRASHSSTATGPQDTLQPVIDWSAQWAESFQQAQKLQLEAFEVQSEIVRRTQAEAAAVVSDLWEQWIAHWGGGAPMDG